MRAFSHGFELGVEGETEVGEVEPAAIGQDVVAVGVETPEALKVASWMAMSFTLLGWLPAVSIGQELAAFMMYTSSSEAASKDAPRPFGPPVSSRASWTGPSTATRRRGRSR